MQTRLNRRNNLKRFTQEELIEYAVLLEEQNERYVNTITLMDSMIQTIRDEAMYQKGITDQIFASDTLDRKMRDIRKKVYGKELDKMNIMDLNEESPSSY